MRAGARRWVFGMSFALVACSSTFELPASLDLGAAELGVERTFSFTVRNSSQVDDVLALGTSGEFRVEPSTLELKAGAEADVSVSFTPSELGPREGTLGISARHASAREVRLTGRGIGPAIDVSPSMDLPMLALVSGQTVGESRGVLRVRNVGTQGTLLNLELPEPSTPELCVGDFIGDVCVPWIPSSIGAGEFVELPLTLRVQDDTPRSWLVTLRSNDARGVVRTVTVGASLARVAPCQFSTAPELTLSQGMGLVFITHTGSERCLVRSMELTTTPSDVVRFTDALSMPRIVHAGESIHRGLGIVSLAQFIEGTLTVRAAGTPPLEIRLRPADGANPCIVVTPSTLDFGTLRQTCNSVTRFVGVYNVCPRPIQLAQVRNPSDEFFVISADVNRDIVRGGPPAFIGVRFRPSGLGVRTGFLELTTLPYATRVVAMQGIGDGPAFHTDTFRQDALPRVDMAFIVDTSPSFAAQRGAVRTQVETILSSAGGSCADVKVAFAPAEGAGPVAYATNDAGSVWTSTLEPDFIARSLSAFDALPASSETESCIGVAERLRGARNDVFFSGFCISDALEQTPDAGGALAGLRAQVSQLQWNVATGLPASSCAVESRDDDQLHRSLTASVGGSTTDLCRPNWAFDFVSLSPRECGPRTSFFLTSTAVPPIEVRVDGQLVSSGWTYEPANAAVVFEPHAAPPPGSTLDITYATSCTP